MSKNRKGNHDYPPQHHPPHTMIIGFYSYSGLRDKRKLLHGSARSDEPPGLAHDPLGGEASHDAQEEKRAFPERPSLSRYQLVFP